MVKAAMKTNKQLLESALRLRAPEFIPFIGYLRSELDEYKDKLTTAPESYLPNLQGRAQCLKEILQLIEMAPSLLNG